MLVGQVPHTSANMCSCCEVKSSCATSDGLLILTSNLLDERRDGLSGFTVDELRGRTCGGISVWIGEVLQLSSARSHDQHRRATRWVRRCGRHCS